MKRRFVVIGILSLILLTACGNNITSIKDIESFVTSVEGKFEKEEIKIEQMKAKARKDLEASGVMKFVQFNHDNEIATVYQLEDEDKANMFLKDFKSNFPKHKEERPSEKISMLGYQQGEYVLKVSCYEDKDVLGGSCPDLESKYKDIEKELGKSNSKFYLE